MHVQMLDFAFDQVKQSPPVTTPVTRICRQDLIAGPNESVVRWCQAAAETTRGSEWWVQGVVSSRHTVTDCNGL